MEFLGSMLFASHPFAHFLGRCIMGVTIREEAGGKVVVAELSGKLAQKDYQGFVPRIEALMAQHGKLRFLVRMHDFHGWTMGGLWEDIKFDWKHFSDIERLAMVGESKWEAGMASFCKPFTRATVRYFDVSKADEAHQWILEGIAVPTAV
jgi:hypothetical protein